MASALRSEGPLDGVALPVGKHFAIRRAPPAARFVLRGSQDAAERVGGVFGAAPSATPRRASVVGARAALWLGPDEWLLVAESEAPEPLGAALEAAFSELPHSLVDVSQRQIGFVLEGPAAARALSAGCPLDLDLRSFAVGDVTRTMLAKAEVVLWRRGPMSFHLEVWRSFAEYAVAFLGEAAMRAPIT
jgi:sarcosine oxidase, subunit gamma